MLNGECVARQGKELRRAIRKIYRVNATEPAFCEVTSKRDLKA